MKGKVLGFNEIALSKNCKVLGLIELNPHKSANTKTIDAELLLISVFSSCC